MRVLRSLLLLVALIPSQGRSEERPFIRGRDWKPLPYEMKLGYVAGIAEADLWVGSMSEALAKSDTGVKYTFPLTCECRRDEILASIEKVFDDPANANVPVIAAYMTHVMRVKGTSDEAVSRFLRGFRSDPPPRP